MFYEQLIMYLQEFGAELLGLYRIQDYIEVVVFIFITYKALSWLKQDHTKHLLLTSYAYFTVLTGTYLFSCSILFSTMMLLAPAFIIFCIVVHQKQLQKNFVLPSKKFFTPTTVPQKNWLESLIQSCLIASHHKKNITCIIERNNNVSALLQAPFMLQLPIQKEITNLLLASDQVADHALLWIHQSGIIQSINVSWNPLLTNEILVQPHDTTSLNHEAATLLTQKTDALIFSINTISDLHTVWYGGKCLKQVSIQQLLKFIQQTFHVSKTDMPIIKERKSHDQNHPSAP